MHTFTDGCAKQYKGRYIFRFLSDSMRRIKFIIMHHYAVTSHFKVCHDGIGGMVKNAMKHSAPGYFIDGAAGVVCFLKELSGDIVKTDITDYLAT